MSAVAVPHTNGATEALYARRRADMVETQLAARGIKDQRVLAAMREVPRHRFIGEALRDRAYEDGPLPIGESQTISQPYIVALMLAALELQGHEKVLEVGAGSAYVTVLLAQLAARVCAIERRSALAAEARRVLKDFGIHNVEIRVGDGTKGWSAQAPFEAILVSAAAPSIPPPLLAQLAEGGRLVIPVGDASSQNLVRVRKKSKGFEEDVLCRCQFVKLIGEHGWNL